MKEIGEGHWKCSECGTIVKEADNKCPKCGCMFGTDEDNKNGMQKGLESEISGGKCEM